MIYGMLRPILQSIVAGDIGAIGDGPTLDAATVAGAGGSTTPANALLADDGVTVLFADDGVTILTGD